MPEEIKTDDLNHDQRVRKIQDEIRQTGKETKSRDEWKGYFKSKGYLDDECDLGYVLEDANISYGVFSPKMNIIALILLGVLIIVIGIKLSWMSRDFREVIVRIFVIVSFLPVLFYIAYIKKQFEGYLVKVIEIDFNGKKADDPKIYSDELKDAGVQLLKYPSAEIEELFSLEYDKRETFFGQYQYTVGSGKSRRVYRYFFVMQRTNNLFPGVHCIRPLVDRNLWKKEIDLESVDFEKHYNVYTENPTDAFYVLNPRVMSVLLEEEVLKYICSFETVGEYLFMTFLDREINTGIRFNKDEPIIKYKDYINLKRDILCRLDLATNINDTISREIIDSGEKRSEAKNI